MGNDPNKPDSDVSNGKFDGKVTLKYKVGDADEQIQNFDLNDPEQRQRMIDLAQKGYGADKTWQKAAELQKVIDNWNKRLEAAKDNDEVFNGLITDLERTIGRKFTKAEKEDIEDKGLDLTDPAMKKVLEKLDTYEKKIESLEKKIQESDVDALADKIENLNERLAKKWNGTDGAPKYDKDKVLEYAGEHGFLIKGDIAEGLENAYKMLNFNAFTEKTQKDVKKAHEEAEKRLKHFQVASDDDPAKLKPDKKKYKNYDEITSDALEEVQARGGLFKPD